MSTIIEETMIPDMLRNDDNSANLQSALWMTAQWIFESGAKAGPFRGWFITDILRRTIGGGNPFPPLSLSPFSQQIACS
jgi:hypothetical protein